MLSTTVDGQLAAGNESHFTVLTAVLLHAVVILQTNVQIGLVSEGFVAVGNVTAIETLAGMLKTAVGGQVATCNESHFTVLTVVPPIADVKL